MSKKNSDLHVMHAGVLQYCTIAVCPFHRKEWERKYLDSLESSLFCDQLKVFMDIFWPRFFTIMLLNDNTSWLCISCESLVVVIFVFITLPKRHFNETKIFVAFKYEMKWLSHLNTMSWCSTTPGSLSHLGAVQQAETQ